ncbi:hypothetical protein AAVH_13050 [Aphelenchoides avenae]|nr:hypothetical protein AAVH_13050 [Aphelenchus avenae]
MPSNRELEKLIELVEEDTRLLLEERMVLMAKKAVVEQLEVVASQLGAMAAMVGDLRQSVQALNDAVDTLARLGGPAMESLMSPTMRGSLKRAAEAFADAEGIKQARVDAPIAYDTPSAQEGIVGGTDVAGIAIGSGSTDMAAPLPEDASTGQHPAHLE